MEIFNSAAELRSKGFTLRDPPLNIVSYDPAGDGKDNDSLVLVAREEWRRGELYDPDLAVEFIFRAQLAYRMEMGLELPDKLAKLLALNRMLNKAQIKGTEAGHVFCVETNGVGYGIASSLRSKLKSQVYTYVTVGRATEKSWQEQRLAMPRLPALDNLRMLMELHRLKSVRGGPGIEQLVEELNAFVWRTAGRPEAMLGAKDDLVMALAGACWIGSKIIPPLIKQQRFPSRAARAKSGTSNVIRIR